MKLKKIISVLVLATITLSTTFNTLIKVEAANDNDAINVINEMVASVEQKDWNSFIDLMSITEQGYFKNYFSSDNNNNRGIKQVESISLESVDHVDANVAKADLLVNEYPILNTSNAETYLVGLSCKVTNENQYFYNGLNYFNITLVRENGEMKIVQFNKPSYSMASEVLSIDTTDSNYSEESAALNTLGAAEEGLLINIEGESIRTASSDNNYSSHPALNTYTNYSAPDTIIVLMNKVDATNPSAVEYPFDYYIRNTLPNEVILSTFGTQALKANAFCVKGVGLYHSIKPVNSAGGYDLTQYTQNFQVDTSHSISDTIFDGIDGKFVVNSSSKVFFPEYGRGTSGQTGSSASGRLLQYGSKKLAENGYTYLEILNYYYSGSDCSTGNVKTVTMQ